MQTSASAAIRASRNVTASDRFDVRSCRTVHLLGGGVTQSGDAPWRTWTVIICAGDGRDLVGAFAAHPRRGDVQGLLVEIDPVLAKRGRAALWPDLDYMVVDAARTDKYLGRVAADLVLACAVFGNVCDDDIAVTVRAMPAFLAPCSHVIWTRHRGAPDLVTTIDS